MKTYEILIQIGIIVCIVLILMIASMLIIHQMGERIREKCEEVDYQGMVSFWDADIDCGQFYGDYEEWREE